MLLDAGIVKQAEPHLSAAGSTDGSLIRLFVERGDRDAMGRLFLRHADACYRLALRLLQNASDAEDALQTAFVNILKSAERFRSGEDSVRAWMMGFVVNACLHKTRENARRSRRESEASAPSNEGLAADTAESKELRHVVRKAVDRLPTHYRLPVWLHYYEGLSTQEVAAALQRPQDTIRKQLSRGLDQLRTRLQAAGSAAALPAITEALSLPPSEQAPSSVASIVEAYVNTGTLPAVDASVPAMAGSPSIWVGTALLLMAAIGGGIALTYSGDAPPNAPTGSAGGQAAGKPSSDKAAIEEPTHGIGMVVVDGSITNHDGEHYWVSLKFARTNEEKWAPGLVRVWQSGDKDLFRKVNITDAPDVHSFSDHYTAFLKTQVTYRGSKATATISIQDWSRITDRITISVSGDAVKEVLAITGDVKGLVKVRP